MKTRVLSIAVMLGYALLGYGQQDLSKIDVPNVLPPTPEATSLAKFTEVPVSKYTGTANVSIPIYTIKEGNIAVPVGLSYHTRGVQVAEIAPRVGIGWALTYGGAISRQIRGEADEAPYGMFRHMDDFKNFLKDKSKRHKIVTSESIGHPYDYSPDKFMINTSSGLNGNFIYDYMDGKPVLEKYSDTKIETLYGDPTKSEYYIKGFKITDTNGMIYYFGTSADRSRTKISYDRTDKNFSYNSKGGGISTTEGATAVYPSAWQLMEVHTPEGRKVEFFYPDVPEVTIYYRKGSDKVVAGGVLSNYSKVSSYQFHIKEIRFSLGSLHFVPNTIERQDVIGGYDLQKIILKDKRGAIIKQYELEYTYTEGGTENQLSFLVNSDPRGRKRLFLSKVHLKNKQGNQMQPPYQLVYDQTLALPSRFSTSQDQWGYFNNASNGNFLTYFDENGRQDNRKVNAVALGAGTLKEIIYPTGGKTVLYFEPNIVKTSFVSKQVTFTDPTETEVKTISLTKKSFQYDKNGFKALPFIIKERGTKIEFHCKHFKVNVDDGCIAELGNCNNDGAETVPDCIFKLGISNDGVSYAPLLPNNRIQPLPGLIYFSINPTGDTDEQDNLLFLKDQYDFAITLSYEVKKYKKYEMYGGGRRVSKIENYESGSNIVSTKTYSYTDSENVSTGELLGLPAYQLKANNSTQKYTIFFQHGNLPGSPLSKSQGNSVGYEKVVEYIGNKSDNIGKIETKYFLTADSGSGYNYPFNIPNSHEWLRGSVLKESVFKSKKTGVNIVYTKLKETENEYLYADYIGFEGTGGIIELLSKQTYAPLNKDITIDYYQYKKTRSLFRLPMMQLIQAGDLRQLSTSQDFMDANVTDELYKKDSNGNYIISGEAYYYKTFQLTGGTVDLRSSTEKIFDEGGILKSVTKNTYDYPNHYMLASSETTNSKGEVLKTVMTYPGAQDVLRTQNRFVPVKTTAFKGGAKLSEQETKYDNFGSMHLPKEVLTAKGGGSLESRLTYHGYDIKGNVREVSKKDGTHITYLWGYDYNHPIAKVENASYAQVMTALGKQTTDNLGYLQTMTEAELQVVMTKLRANLPMAQVSSYTYIPLVGVSTITDPRGQKMTYHYDAYNRLQYVKDSQGNILKEHKYNYKN